MHAGFQAYPRAQKLAEHGQAHGSVCGGACGGALGQGAVPQPSCWWEECVHLPQAGTAAHWGLTLSWWRSASKH